MNGLVRRSFWTGVVVLTLTLWGDAAEGAPLRILLTNDDGWGTCSASRYSRALWRARDMR